MRDVKQDERAASRRTHRRGPARNEVSSAERTASLEHAPTDGEKSRKQDSIERPFDQIDAAVGAALRQLRRARRASQQEIADRLGVTVQQIQKYERGENRMTAAALYLAADLLDVGVEAFYAGLKGPASPFVPPKREDRVIIIPLPGGASSRYVKESELVGVIADYREIANASLRASVRQLVRRIADDAKIKGRGR